MRNTTIKYYIDILNNLCENCKQPDGSGDFKTCKSREKIKCCSYALIEASIQSDLNGEHNVD